MAFPRAVFSRFDSVFGPIHLCTICSSHLPFGVEFPSLSSILLTCFVTIYRKKAFRNFAEFKAAVDRESQVPPVTSSPSEPSPENESSESSTDVVDLTEPVDDVIAEHEETEKGQDAFRVEICTPSDFNDEFKTEVVITPDVDTEMKSAFDDWDSDESESDEDDDDEGDYDLESEEEDSLTSPHESLVFNFPLPPSGSECEEQDEMQNQCVQMRFMPRGTPSRAPLWASGNILQMRAEREARGMA